MVSVENPISVRLFAVDRFNPLDSIIDPILRQTSRLSAFNIDTVKIEFLDSGINASVHSSVIEGEWGWE